VPHARAPALRHCCSGLRSITPALHLPDQKSRVLDVALSANGNLLATTAEASRRVLIWDVSGSKPAAPIFTSPQAMKPFRRLAFSPNSQWLAAGTAGVGGGGRDRVVVYDVKGKKVRYTFIQDGEVDALAFSRTSSILAVGSFDALNDRGSIKFYDLKTGTLLNTFPIRSAYASSLAYSGDGKTLPAGLSNGTVLMLNVSEAKPVPLRTFVVRKPKGDEANAVSLTFDAGGTMLVTGDAVGNVKSWDMKGVQKGESTFQTPRRYPGPILSIAVDYQDQTFLVGGQGKLMGGPIESTGLGLPRGPR
jgi:WD40 repeat protein